MIYITKLLNNNSVLPPPFLLTLRVRTLHVIWVSTVGTYDRLETLNPRRNLRPVLWAFYSIVQGLICRNLNDLLANLNIYFSKDMSVDRNGSKGTCHLQGHRKTKSNSVKRAKMKWIYPRSSPWIPPVQLEPNFQWWLQSTRSCNLLYKDTEHK